MDRALAPKIEDLLSPARQRLQRLRRLQLLQASLAECAWVLPLAGGLAMLVCLVLPPFGLFVSGQVRLIVGVVVLAALVCFVRLTLSYLKQETSWLEAAQVLDTESNPHNLIATAYDTLLQGHGSVFAKMAVDRGVAVLREVEAHSFRLPDSDCFSSRSRWGLAACLLLIILMALVPCVDGERFVSDGVTDVPSTTPIPASTSVEKTSKTGTQAQAALAGIPLAGVSALGDPGRYDQQSPQVRNTAAAGLSASEAGPATQHTATQASAASGAAASKALGDQRKSTGKSRSRPADPTVATIAEKRTPSARMHQRAGSGGSPDSESALRASLLSGERERAGDDETEDDKRKEKQKQPALAGTAGQPLMSDRQGAPSRELGMSGKKSGRPGDGRGGPGTQKKSRATATVLSGLPVPVHVKGMKQPGKSKSQARMMPFSADRNAARPPVTAVVPGREGAVQRYCPDERWRLLIDRYTELLRQSESTVLE